MKAPVTEFNLSIPAKRPSAWVTETDPKLARAGIDALPIADSVTAARELYQAIYALNRLDIDPEPRFEIMEMYATPVATVVTGLHGRLATPALPMSQAHLQLAELIRALYVEMANGYKCCLDDLSRHRPLWGRKLALAPAVERALYYLGGVLLRSYFAYLPQPPGVWREIHALYHAAEAVGQLDEPISGPGSPEEASVRRSYLRVLLLAMANPYQLSATDQLLAYRFLGKWASAATVTPMGARTASATQYVVDLSADGAPIAGWEPEVAEDKSALRLLDTGNLIQVLQGFVTRIRRGESIPEAELGIDCLGPVSGRLLRRLGRSWAHMARRRHSRIRRNSSVLLCRGINALHFFLTGQPSSVSPTAEAGPDSEEAAPDPVAANQVPYRIDRWRVGDFSPNGLNLAYAGDVTAYIRIGDIVGIQRPGQMGNWSAGVVRWLQSRGANALEMGVELIAPKADPVTVTRLSATPGEHRTVALMLAAVPAARQPESLLVTRGWHDPSGTLEIAALDGTVRHVRVLRLIERNGTFEQFVIADAAEDQAVAG
jgi:hypothetical protein